MKAMRPGEDLKYKSLIVDLSTWVECPRMIKKAQSPSLFLRFPAAEISAKLMLDAQLHTGRATA